MFAVWTGFHTCHQFLIQKKIENEGKKSWFDRNVKKEKLVYFQDTAGKMIEQVVCKVSDVKEGEMKQVAFGSGKALLTLHNGVISAVSSKCTHYSAPLITGAYKGGRVRCPWHGACFNTQTGDIEDYPGLDSLQKYEVLIKNEDIILRATEEAVCTFRRVKHMTTVCNADELFLIIGGGVSGLVCAETLRQEGFYGKVIIATKERHLPYDRPKLSKTLNAAPESLYLRDLKFYEENNIDLLLEKEAASLDSSSHVVSFTDGSSIKYNKLYIATGGQPRILNVPGANLKNIFYLRTPDDALNIHNSCQGKNVVIIGTGFIGLELASYLVSKSLKVTVVGSGRGKVPFEDVLGERIGKMFMKLHEEKGVEFCLDKQLQSCQGDNEEIQEVVFSDGTSLTADMVLVGIGVTPSTTFMKDSDIRLNERGHIIVDKFMSAGSNVYAGGDIVAFPNPLKDDDVINIGHWQLASAHGRCAGLNMVGKQTVLNTVPFFWTMQYGKALRYAGCAPKMDEIIYEGNVEEMKFTAYYISDGKVTAVACMNMGAKASEMAFLLEEGKSPNVEQLRKSLT